ncbi:MAG: hypothetical protein ACTHLK_07710 [Brucella intermedia]
MGKRSKISRWLAIYLVAGCILNLPAELHAQQAAGAEVSVGTEETSHHPAPATDTFGQTQFVLSGDPIVPPRDYAKGSEIPNPGEYDLNESGTIFDIVYRGVVDGRMRFEIRGYTANDLQTPDTEQMLDFPADQHAIEIRNIRIDVDAAELGSLTYRANRLSDGTAK